MKFCPECGTALQSETIKFCSNCGINLAPPPPAAPVAPIPQAGVQQNQGIPTPQPPEQLTSAAASESRDQTKDQLKKLGMGFGKFMGKAAVSAGKYTVEKVLPKLLQFTKEQLEDVIENASKEEDSGVKEGTTGREFEGIVAEIFQVRKYRIVQRNYHVHQREVDLVAARGGSAVMIECKARSAPVGAAELDSYATLFKQLKGENFDGSKLQKLIVVAPKGGVSSDAKSKAIREYPGMVEFWERDRFLLEYEKVKQE